MNLRRDNPSPDELDELFVIMAAIMPDGLFRRKFFVARAAMLPRAVDKVARASTPASSSGVPPGDGSGSWRRDAAKTRRRGRPMPLGFGTFFFDL